MEKNDYKLVDMENSVEILKLEIESLEKQRKENKKTESLVIEKCREATINAKGDILRLKRSLTEGLLDSFKNSMENAERIDRQLRRKRKELKDINHNISDLLEKGFKVPY